MGLHRAWPHAEIVGIDKQDQPSYPFVFVRGDALQPPVELASFDFIWASPPCQAYSKTRAIHGKTYPDLVGKTRELLTASGKPYAIENVGGAPLRAPVMLCGTMFGLRVLRHRYFETSHPIALTPQCGRHGGTNSHRGYSTGAEFVTVAGNNYRRTEGAEAMGIDWMKTRRELSEAIPPAYSEFIARSFALQKPRWEMQPYPKKDDRNERSKRSG